MYLYKDSKDFYLTHDYYERISTVYPKYRKHEYKGRVNSGYSVVCGVLENDGKCQDVLDTLESFYDGYSPIDGYEA